MATSDSTYENRHIVEKKFCDKCYREVRENEITAQPIIVVNDGKIIRIYDKLLHESCGGMVRSLTLSYDS